jgi:quercetin dioxygenase-like cupin family protein
MSDEQTNATEPIELGFIENLEDMISVQEGSTVSRTVMQKQGGNVVLFSFDAGEELSEHTAAMPVFVQTLKGRLKVTGNGKTVDLVPGGLAYFPTRIPHAVYAEEPSIMMLTMITPARNNIGD